VLGVQGEEDKLGSPDEENGWVLCAYAEDCERMAAAGQIIRPLPAAAVTPFFTKDGQSLLSLQVNAEFPSTPFVAKSGCQRREGAMARRMGLVVDRNRLHALAGSAHDERVALAACLGVKARSEKASSEIEGPGLKQTGSAPDGVGLKGATKTTDYV
jgi:hypothetical protein